MGSRFWTIWWVSLICTAALLVGLAPSARAAAPMCDVRGASAIAPIPIAIVVQRDINWEPEPFSVCLSWSVPGPALVESNPTPERGPARRTAGPDADETLTLPTLVRLVGAAPSRSSVSNDLVLLHPGHYPEVFRPPRPRFDVFRDEQF